MGDQRLQERMFAQRQERGDDIQLIIWARVLDERVYIFDDELSLVAFMSGFEADAIASGWSLTDFIPERRSGQDRRSASRGADRRRPVPSAPGTLITFPKRST